jgi:hypothetical protein
MNQEAADLLVGLPQARVGAAVVKLENSTDILMFGGRRSTGPSAELWRGTITGLSINWKRLTASLKCDELGPGGLPAGPNVLCPPQSPALA